VAYVIDTMTADLDINDAKAKAEVARRVKPLIEDVPEPVERDHYLQLLARRLRVDERVLQRVALPAAARQHNPAQRSRGQQKAVAVADENLDRVAGAMAGGKLVTHIREAAYLRQCLRHPHLMQQVDERLRRQQQPPVTEEDFSAPEDKALLSHLRSQLRLHPVATIDELCDSLDDVLLGRVQSLLEETSDLVEAEAERLPDSLARLVLDIRLERLRRLLSEVQQLLHDTHEGQETKYLESYRQQLKALHKARSAMSAIRRRQMEEAAQ
jgi:DNA primase